MTDTNVVWQVTWPHVTYTPSGQPAINDQLDTMDFVIGYLTVATATERIKARMLFHFQQLMEGMGSTMAGHQ